MLCTAIAMGAQNIEQNFFPISAIFSCRFYVKTKWNSLLIFQILFSSKTQIFCIQKCIRSTFFNILAKIKTLWWTLGSLNHSHKHGFTDKCQDTRVFQTVLRGGGKSPQWEGESKILLRGILLLGDGNLRGSDFQYLKLLQS